MPLSGEAIRLMNYIDDVAVTLRRVLATIPSLYMTSSPAYFLVGSVILEV